VTQGVAAEAIVIVAFASAWAWLYVRVRVLRAAGASSHARRLAQRNGVLFGGMAFAVTALIWTPTSARGWVYWPAATLAVIAFLVVTLRGTHESRPERANLQPRTRRRFRRLVALIFAFAWGFPAACGVAVGLVAQSVGWGFGAALLTAATVMLVGTPVILGVRALRARARPTRTR
jgi:hypothetical protein